MDPFIKNPPMLLPTSKAVFSRGWSPSCIPTATVVGLLGWAQEDGTCMGMGVCLLRRSLEDLAIKLNCTQETRHHSA